MNLEVLAEQLRQITPLIEKTAKINTEIALIKREIEALGDHKISNHDLTKFELELSEKHSQNQREIDKQFSEFRNKLIKAAIIEKIVIAVIISLIVGAFK